MVIEVIDELVRALRADPRVLAIGLSSESIPQTAGEGDIDLFVYCGEIPEPEARKSLYPEAIRDCERYAPRVFVDARWGDSDYSEVNGIATWITYFRVDDVVDDFESVVRGERAAREGGYYPTGRLAMFKRMMTLHDEAGFIEGLKRRLDAYPEVMGDRIREQCIREMQDEEDLVRACARKDVLFFHTSIDAAVDALLRYLFAINRELFPSRKRNAEMIDGFGRRPDRFVERLHEVLRLGTSEDSLGRSLEEYRRLREEVMALGEEPN